jgi:hypothetical protein
MNINEVYEFLQYISDKNQSGNLTPKEFNVSMPRALNEWVMTQYNNVNNVAPNKKGWQRNQGVTDKLKFLIVRKPYFNVDNTGVLVLPDDYLHLSSIVYKYKINKDGNTFVRPINVDITRDNEVASFLGSYIYQKKIEAKKYVLAVMYDDSIQFYPENIGVVDFTYLRKPVNPVWAYTLQNGRPVYDPINSVNLEAPEEAVNEIVMMCASYLGMNLRENDLIQYSEMKQQKGV